MLSSYAWVAACLAALHDLSCPLARGSRLGDSLGPLDVLFLHRSATLQIRTAAPVGNRHGLCLASASSCVAFQVEPTARTWGVRGEARRVPAESIVTFPSPAGADHSTAPLIDSPGS
jgi:hypothetical protein